MSTALPSNVSAFFSYAGDDYDQFSDWIEIFRQMAQRQLSARLRSVMKLETIESYRSNGAVSGDLQTVLEKKIAASSVMVIFVHDNYLRSDVCRQELQLFCGRFDATGPGERLFVICMSEKARDKLLAMPHWTATFDTSHPIYMDFFERDHVTRPVPTHQSAVDGTMLPGKAFMNQFAPFVEQAAACLTSPLPNVEAKCPPSSAKPLWVIGAHRDELAASVADIRRRLDQTGDVRVDVLDMSRLVEGDLAQLDEADTFVLPFNHGAPLLPFTSAGHLDIQASDWLARRKGVGKLHWLDLTGIAPARRASEAQLAAIEALALPRVTASQLLRTPQKTSTSNAAVIYIESNKKELDHWDALGKRLKPHWSQIANGTPPHLDFLHHGLPIDTLDNLSLADADGFILLWGQKDPRALVAQISEVETRLGRRNLPPGIVAYLVPPHPGSEHAVPAYGWRVLQFNALGQDDIDVVQSESNRLHSFLREVYERVERRCA
jgi:hypothetical protein